MVNFSSVTDSAPRLSDRLILFKDYVMKDEMCRNEECWIYICSTRCLRSQADNGHIVHACIIHFESSYRAVNNPLSTVKIVAYNMCDVERGSPESLWVFGTVIPTLTLSFYSSNPKTIETTLVTLETILHQDYIFRIIIGKLYLKHGYNFHTINGHGDRTHLSSYLN